jgi:DNA modification methylase
MAFKYHPPTRSECSVCTNLLADNAKPLINNGKGKASSANGFPIHNWYSFVLGYSPEFPDYFLTKESVASSDLVIDPFMGAGTTLVCCKYRGIPSKGIDANDFFVDAARTKLFWHLNTLELRNYRNHLLECVFDLSDRFNWNEDDNVSQPSFWHSPDKQSYRDYAQKLRPRMLPERYISDKPFAKIKILEDAIQRSVTGYHEEGLFELALYSILLPASNVRYGPGFGVIKPRDDIDVFQLFSSKLDRMILDLEHLAGNQRNTPSDVVLGDTRNLSRFFAPESASFMITSPPYPGDHEYTKHTRLELVFRGTAVNRDDFRTIKKRMLQASTTNIYRDLDDSNVVRDITSIESVTDLIHKRLIQDGASSGFEKLYTTVVWQYFGGMCKSLKEIYTVLKPKGKIALLVSDSHAFKMVHIQTAEILKEIGLRLGFVNPEIVLWQLKTSTSHKYYLRENVLVLQKP